MIIYWKRQKRNQFLVLAIDERDHAFSLVYFRCRWMLARLWIAFIWRRICKLAERYVLLHFANIISITFARTHFTIQNAEENAFIGFFSHVFFMPTEPAKRSGRWPQSQLNRDRYLATIITYFDVILSYLANLISIDHGELIAIWPNKFLWNASTDQRAQSMCAVCKMEKGKGENRTGKNAKC